MKTATCCDCGKVAPYKGIVADPKTITCGDCYKKRIEKYENPDPRCTYPFTPDPLGYCWGYACHVDGDPQFKDFNCEGCECWVPEMGEKS